MGVIEMTKKRLEHIVASPIPIQLAQDKNWVDHKALVYTSHLLADLKGSDHPPDHEELLGISKKIGVPKEYNQNWLAWYEQLLKSYGNGGVNAARAHSPNIIGIFEQTPHEGMYLVRYYKWKGEEFQPETKTEGLHRNVSIMTTQEILRHFRKNHHIYVGLDLNDDKEKRVLFIYKGSSKYAKKNDQ